MNEVKLLTIKNRIRKAWQVLTGKPGQEITVGIGIRVKRCDECERGECDACGYKMHSGELLTESEAARADLGKRLAAAQQELDAAKVEICKRCNAMPCRRDGCRWWRGGWWQA